MIHRHKNYFPGLIATLLIILCFSGCFYFPVGSLYVTSNPAGARIFLNGVDTGKVTPALINNLWEGSYTLLLTLDNPSMSSTRAVAISHNQTTSIHLELVSEVKYRALCIGIDKYRDPRINSLYAPPYDVERVRQVLEHARFGDNKNEFSEINTLVGAEATRSNILQGITHTFSQAESSDVSYFYFSGHGFNESGTITIVTYDSDITVQELADLLGGMPGTKVVILDSCFSGGFIGKDIFSAEELRIDSLQRYNTGIINSFTWYDSIVGRGNLAAEGFVVITSASGIQECFETINPHPIDGKPYGYFTAALCDGCGYNNNFNFPYPADSNRDHKVSLNEIYHYIDSSPSLSHLAQDVQIYPQNSSFSFLEY